MRIHGFVSKPEIQKLNRNSIYVFVNGRLIRDRLVQHALTEAYRNIIPPTVYPVVLLFLEMPAAEVDVNVHPSKTEVRFRQQSAMHDFVRDSVRAALMKARPVPQFVAEIRAHATASGADSRRIDAGSWASGCRLRPPARDSATTGGRRIRSAACRVCRRYRRDFNSKEELRSKPTPPSLSRVDWKHAAIAPNSRALIAARSLDAVPDHDALRRSMSAKKSRRCRLWPRSSRWDRFAIRSSSR